MRPFTIRFAERVSGAIGRWDWHTKTVRADHDKGAILALYDTHEHIKHPREILDDGSERAMSFSDATPR